MDATLPGGTPPQKPRVTPWTAVLFGVSVILAVYVAFAAHVARIGWQKTHNLHRTMAFLHEVIVAYPVTMLRIQFVPPVTDKQFALIKGIDRYHQHLSGHDAAGSLSALEFWKSIPGSAPKAELEKWIIDQAAQGNPDANGIIADTDSGRAYYGVLEFSGDDRALVKKRSEDIRTSIFLIGDWQLRCAPQYSSVDCQRIKAYQDRNAAGAEAFVADAAEEDKALEEEMAELRFGEAVHADTAGIKRVIEYTKTLLIKPSSAK